MPGTSLTTMEQVLKQQTRSKTLQESLYQKEEILVEVKKLLAKEELSGPVRLLGVTLSNLNNEKKETEVYIQSAIEF